MDKKFLLHFICLGVLLLFPFVGAKAQVYTPSDGTYTLNYTVSGSNATITGGTFGSGFTGSLVIPAQVTDAGKTYTVTEIKAYAFQKNTSINNLTIPEGLKIIGARAFDTCTKLTGEVRFPSSLTTIGDVCFARTAIKKVWFPGNSQVTKIPAGCFDDSGLEEFNLPSGLISIGENAFLSCNMMGNQDVVFPASLQTIGRQAFALWRDVNIIPEFTDRNKLVFPENSQLTSIGESAFRNGKWYGDLNLPIGITRIEAMTFTRNEQWDGHITLPENLEYIGANAFELVGSTQNLEIPAKVIEIGKEAFYNSPFSGISFKPGAQVKTLGTSVFKYCFNMSYLDLSNVTNMQASNASREASTSNPSQYAYMPPYTMVYLPQGSTVKQGEENFVANGICDKFVVYDIDKDSQGARYFSIKDRAYGDRQWIGQERRVTPDAPTPENFNMNRGCDYIIQHPFKATTATYTNRDFAKTKDKTYTVCLPYPAKVPAGLRAYKLNKKMEGGFYFLSVDNGQMEANQPYVLRVVNPDASLVFGNESEVQVPQTIAAVQTETPQDNLIFRGTTGNIFNKEARNHNYHNLSGGIWYPVKTTTSDVWNGTTAQDKANGFQGFIRSLRAYIETPQAAGAKLIMMFDDADDAATTSISSVEQSVKAGTARIYTVDGRYAGTDFDSLPAGRIYIISGKKVYKF